MQLPDLIGHRGSTSESDVVVPGHGNPVELAKAEADTCDYLVFLRRSAGGCR